MAESDPAPLPESEEVDSLGDELLREIESDGLAQDTQISGEKLEGHLHLIQNGEDPYAADETSPLTVTPGLEGKLTEEQYQTLKSTFSRMMASIDDGDVYMTPYHLTYDEAAAIAEEVINSNPDFWYVADQFWYSNNSDGTLASISFVYQADRDTLKELQGKYRAALDEAVSWIPQNASTAEKVKAAHDWLVRNVAYNEEAADLGSYAYPHTIETDPWSAYGTLVAKLAVCQGYALAFSAILNAVGIESNYAHTDGHVWNRVLIDGSWYHVDVTWDDPVPDSGFDLPPSTEYFLKSDQGLRAIGDKTHQQWWLTAPACTSTKFDNKRDWPTYREPAGNKVKVTSFELSSTALNLGMNKSAKLEIINKAPANATTYGAVWTSSNEDVASVDSLGRVYARETSGTTTITCTVDGISRSCEVTVKVTVDDFSIYFPDAYDTSDLEYEYKGSAWEPEPIVELGGGNRLELGKDYTVSYRDNVNAGTATVIITGKGEYSGTKEIPFTISPLQIAFPDYTGNLLCDVAFSKDSYAYTGKPVEPKPVITYTGGYFYEENAFELVEGRDYKLSYRDNVDPGYATIIVTGINNCSGEFEEEFYIDPEPIISQVDISAVTVEPIAAVNYTGKDQKPKPVVTYAGVRLEENIDYTLSYENNVNLGTATVILTGIGMFKGTTSATFTIVKAKINLADAFVAKVVDRTYTGQAIKPKPVVTYQGANLTAGTDYTVSYDNNVNVGIASLTITGKGNYSGSKTISFKIAPADIAQATVASIGNNAYTGSAIKPAPVVTFGSATLAAGTDYSVTYDKNVNVGTATVTIAGKGNFTGTKSVSFKIVAADLSKRASMPLQTRGTRARQSSLCRWSSWGP